MRPDKLLSEIALSFFYVLPQVFISWFARVFAFFFTRIPGRDRDTLFLNVEKILGLPRHSFFAQSFARQVAQHQARCSLESLQTMAILDRKKADASLLVEGFEELRRLVSEAEKNGRGHIMVTAHIGSWELCAYFARLASTRRLSVLAKPPKWGQGLIERFRSAMNVDVLWTDRGSALMKRMLSELRQGNALGVVMDQKPEGRKGPVVSFFGIPTAFVVGPALMVQRVHCDVLSIFCLRLGPRHYRIVSKRLTPDGEGFLNQSLEQTTQVFAHEIEAIIRLYPEQWTWNYKRWRFDRPIS